MQSIATSGATTSSLDLRQQSRQLTVENIPITLIDQGSGTPTLLLHGLFDSADTWGGVVERMRGRYRLLVPDLPGFGSSGAPADYDLSLPHLAQFLEQVLHRGPLIGRPERGDPDSLVAPAPSGPREGPVPGQPDQRMGILL